MAPSVEAMPHMTRSTVVSRRPSRWPWPAPARWRRSRSRRSRRRRRGRPGRRPSAAPCGPRRRPSRDRRVSAVTVDLAAPPAFSFSWRACSTAYSSSSESRPSTPTRSTVLSDSKWRSAVASGTYFTQTTMFMVVRRLPSCRLRVTRPVASEGFLTHDWRRCQCPRCGRLRAGSRGPGSGRRPARRPRRGPS